MITLDTLNLVAAERRLVEEALRRAGSIVDAAPLLGITRHALKRRIIMHGIRWSRSSPATRPRPRPAGRHLHVVQGGRADGPRDERR